MRYITRSIAVAAVTVATEAAVQLPAGASGTLVADWEMNEGSGTTMADGAGTSDGTLYHVTVNDGYYSFNGVDSLVTATEDFAIGSADISFTTRFRFWQKPSSTVGDYDLVRGVTSGKWKLEIVRRNSGKTAKANCHFGGTKTGAALAAGPSLDDGQWHVVTCTKTASDIELTVDGTTYRKSVTIGDINATGKQITLGGQSAGADEYLGDLDYVRVNVG